MAAREFYAPEARARVADEIRAIERLTSAEVVVALRRRSGHYRHTDYLVGLTLAALGLLVFLYHPEPFDYDVLPLEEGALFALGAVTSAYLAPLRRAMTAPGLLEENVRVAARAAFVDLGVSKTRGRTGLLVYVSMFERRVELVPDVGLDPASLGEGFARAKAALERSVSSSPDLDAFLRALRALGPALAEAWPRAHDDQNELADELPEVPS